tara:strand:+ start:158 stop:643 length:486 start_codon:yes stop_codon:yes gene_type:complete
VTEIEYQAGKSTDPATLNRRTFVSVCSLTNWVSVGLSFYFVLSGPIRFVWWSLPLAGVAIWANTVATIRFVRHTEDLQARLVAGLAAFMVFVVWASLPILVILMGYLEATFPREMHNFSHSKGSGNVVIAIVMFLFSPTYLAIWAHARSKKHGKQEAREAE